MAALYLTPAEERLFRTLPDAIIHGCDIAQEQLTFQDSYDRRRMRFDLIQLKTPELFEVARRLQGSTSSDEILKLVDSIDIRTADPKDVSRLFFALGPDVISIIINQLLSTAATSDNIDDIGAFTEMRHDMLTSLQQISS